MLRGRDGAVPSGSLPHGVQLLGEEGSAWQCETCCWTALRGYLSLGVTKCQQSWESRFIHRSERVPKFQFMLVGLTLLSLLESKNEL